jgi:thiosulfate/3-mercaptopyruvate sulfurtransferase
MYRLLIDPSALDRLLRDSACVVFDVRHDLLDHQAGFKAWSLEHIPGAVFLDHEHDLCAQKTGTNGRHPLPSLDDFLALMRTHGVGPGVQVVIYDGGAGAFAAHLWWMLRWMGHDAVAVLDGGWAAWKASGLPVASAASDAVAVVPAAASKAQTGLMSTDVDSAPADAAGVNSSAGRTPFMPVVNADQVLANIAKPRFVVVDARAENRFRGETEPMDPVAGHIPGALNRPNSLNCQPDGRFLPAEQLREAFDALLGETRPVQVVHQCGSGITACHNLFAMELAGLSGSALYPGSWSEWCSDPERPVATGE